MSLTTANRSNRRDARQIHSDLQRVLERLDEVLSAENLPAQAFFSILAIRNLVETIIFNYRSLDWWWLASDSEEEESMQSDWCLKSDITRMSNIRRVSVTVTYVMCWAVVLLAVFLNSSLRRTLKFTLCMCSIAVSNDVQFINCFVSASFLPCAQCNVRFCNVV